MPLLNELTRAQLHHVIGDGLSAAAFHTVTGEFAKGADKAMATALMLIAGLNSRGVAPNFTEVYAALTESMSKNMNPEMAAAICDAIRQSVESIGEGSVDIMGNL